MTFHPIFVHFPVAILTIYTLFELARFKKITEQPYWFYIKAAFVIVGTLGSFAAYLTGDGAKFVVLHGTDAVVRTIANPRQVIGIHESWARATVVVFSALAGGYGALWLQKMEWFRRISQSYFQKLWNAIMLMAHVIVETRFAIVLALTGLACVTVTGSLGGALVYGPNTDPVVRFIYSIIVP